MSPPDGVDPRSACLPSHRPPVAAAGARRALSTRRWVVGRLALAFELVSAVALAWVCDLAVAASNPTPPATPASPAAQADVIDIAPWGYRGADGLAAGVYADILQMIASRSGCALQLRVVPILRSVTDVTENRSQLTMMLDRQDMNDGAVLLGTVLQLPIEIWLPLGSPVRSLTDLQGRTVAVLRGPAFHEGIQADARINKMPVTLPRQQLEMLRAGRVDAALGVEQNFAAALRALDLGADQFAAPIKLGRRDVNLWLANDWAQHPCRERWSQALLKLRQDGSIARRLAQVKPN